MKSFEVPHIPTFFHMLSGTPITFPVGANCNGTGLTGPASELALGSPGGGSGPHPLTTKAEIAIMADFRSKPDILKAMDNKVDPTRISSTLRL